MVLRFQHACNGELPENVTDNLLKNQIQSFDILLQAVVACKDGDGNNLYVARAYGSERPGVAYPEKYKVRNISSSCEETHGIWLSKFFLQCFRVS